MLKGKICSFKLLNYNTDILNTLNQTSAVIWNDVINISSDYLKNNNNQWISKTQLQKFTKQKYNIHSQSIQAVVHKYCFARESTKKAKAITPDIKYPYRFKKYFNTKWAKDGFKVNNNIIELSLGLINHKKQVPIKLEVNDLFQGIIKEIELIYKNDTYKLSITYDDLILPKENNFNNISAIDVGEINIIASTCNNGNTLIMGGRKLRSVKQLRNKKLAELYSKLSKCTKGSKKYKQYKKAIKYTKNKTEQQIKDMLHKTTKEYVKWCIDNQIKAVVIGDLEGVQRNKKHKKNKLVNQKISQMNFGLLYKYLEYKLLAEGVSLKKVDEAYTSQTCPVCGVQNKTNNRNYKCKHCGYINHRDILGSNNILTKELYNKCLHVTIKEQKYLRVA